MQKISKYVSQLKLAHWISFLLVLLFFLIPVEHKYDKLFRFYSLTLLPHNFVISKDFDPKIYFYISDFLGIFFLIWTLVKLRLKIFEKGGAFLFALFGFTIFSLIFSKQSNIPIFYIRLLQLLTPISLFVFLANAPINKERLFKLVSWTFFSMGLIQSFLAILQYFGQQNLGLRLLGEQRLCSVINVPEGHRWIFDLWLNHSASPSLFRAMGTMPHPNVLGGFLLFSLLMTAYLFMKHPNIRKWLALGYFVQMFGLFITFSRSALFATIIASAIWLIWMRFRQQISIRAAALLILISAMISGCLLTEQIAQRGGVVNYASLARSSDQVRFFYQDLSIRMIKKHPLIGFGYQQYSESAASLLPPGTDLMTASKSVVHNIYLLIGAESGLLSLTAFLGWIALLIRSAWRSNALQIETGLLLAVFIGYLFIGGCDFYPIFFQQGKLLFFGCAGLLALFGSFKKASKPVAILS